MLIDEVRMREIAKEYYQIIYSFCLSYLKSEADAKDVTQDVFMLMIQKSEELNDDNIRAWLFEVASRKIKVKFRELRKHTGCICFDDDTCEIPDAVNDVYFFEKEEEIDDDEIFAMKDEIMCRLTPDEKIIYNYVYVDKLHYAEIAEKLGITKKAVNIKSFRLRKKIKSMVKSAFLSMILLIFAL